MATTNKNFRIKNGLEVSNAIGVGADGTSFGTAGQVLTSNGTSSPAIWVDQTSLSSSTVKHQVKLGEAIAKGQAVYVSTATGANMIVSKASNATEATSSKTMGLLETGGVLNDQVNVITEGMLDNINVGSASAGDPVWLGTSGNLIYGLTNKPIAPAHLVFIGIVTKEGTAGRIFIRVQNGFELNEIHNVLIGTDYTANSIPTNNEVLAYDSSSNLWINQTAEEAGLANLSGATFTGNVAGTNLSLSGDANVAGKLYVTARSGDEGGEIFLSNAATNTTITNGVTIDVYQDKLRIFEQGGTARGAYIDLTAAGAGVSTNLLAGGGGGGGSGTVTSLTFSSPLTGGTITTSGTVGINASNTSTANYVVQRDADGSFSANVITANLTGTAQYVTNGVYTTTTSLPNVTNIATLNTVGNITSGTWSANLGAVSAANLTSVPSMVTSDTKPSPAVDGQVWFNSATGKTYVYYDDSTSSQWVEVFGAKDIVDLKNRTIAVESNVTATQASVSAVAANVAIAQSDINTIEENIGLGNYLINGGFEIWQRGTTFGALDGYGPDRWYFDKNGTTTEVQETTEVPSGFQYSFKLDCTNTTSGGRVYVQQALESDVVKNLRGKTVTFSCWLKLNSNMQAIVGTFNLVASYSTSTDARASQTTSIGSQSIVMAEYGSWKKATYTFVVPSNAVGLRVGVEPPSGTTAQPSSTYYMTGAQLEEGSIATTFRRNGSNPQAELAACQRYYQKIVAGQLYSLFASGLFNTTTAFYMPIHLPVTMRTVPAFSWGGAMRVLHISAGVVGTLSMYTYSAVNPVSLSGTITVATTDGAAGVLGADNDAAAYLEFDAEL